MRPPGTAALLVLVTDRGAARGPLPEAVEAAVAGGVDWVQVRERGLEGAEHLALVDACRAAARRGAARRGGAVRVLVNGRADLALAAGADGVHLGTGALPARAARALLGPAALVGVAAHAPAELAEASASGLLDYAHLAPIFAPLSKAGERPPLGPEALAEAARAGLPVLAQGGIDAASAGACLEAGAAGVAVTGALLAAEDPRAAAAALRRALEEASGRGRASRGRRPEPGPGSGAGPRSRA